MLGYRDPLRTEPQRILVAGVTGSGKSTLARLISERLALPYTEIDSLFHGPNWTPRLTFLEDVEQATKGNRWVAEWQYPAARPLLADRADTLVWLDHRSVSAFARVVRRTVRRARTHEVLWNGNVEPPLRSFFTEPDENILRWAIKSRGSYRSLVPALESTHPGLQIVRLCGQREVDYWFEALGS